MSLRSERAIARRSFRQIVVGTVSWALAFGATVAATATTYANTYPDAAERARLAATTGRDRGMAMLLGPISEIGTVGGYTVYKNFAFLTAIGAVWGLLIATRLLRGEEDTGRWQLVLAGATRARRATVAALAACFAAVGVVYVGTTAITLLAARNPDLGFGTTDSFLYGLSLVVTPAVFVAVGAVTSQLGRTRRVATGLGMGVFGVMFVVRMIADAGPATKWLLWFTPFGWVERMRPFTAADLRPLAVAVVSTAALIGVAIALAARRDTGAGIVSTRDVSEIRPRGLRSSLGLAFRLDTPVLVAWCVGAVAAGFAFGTIAQIAEDLGTSSVEDVLDKFGVGHHSFLLQYLGVAFLFFAMIVALVSVSEIGAAADDERSGRLVQLLVQPIRRTRAFVGRLVIAAGAIAVTALLTGIATWLGARSQGVDAGFVRLVGAGLNLVPTALVVLGVGAVVLAIAPRAATPAIYGVVIGSVLIDLVASLMSGARWLQRLSLFHYMALAPAQSIDATTVIVMLAVAVALCGGATLLFRARDIGRV